MVPYLLDIGNIIFFIATLPQLLQTYENRYELKDLSKIGFSLMAVGTVFFLVVAVITHAYATIALTAFNIIYNLITVYWIVRCKD